MADTVESLEIQITHKASGAASALKSIANAMRSVGKEARPAANGIKQLSDAASKSKKPLQNFVDSLKRIAFYRFIRSIIKSITSAFQEGLKNAYQYSKLIDGDLANALDTLSTKSLTMKNQLGAAFGGLITMLMPIALQIISIVTAIANALTRMFAILGGKSEWQRAKDVWTEWGETASGAGKAAKEALKYLAPFDEINRLPGEDGGGGSGGASTPDYSEMFEMVSTDVGSGLLGTLQDTFRKIADFFENTDWQDLGSKFWQKIKDLFSNSDEADSVVATFFEALGAAFGAVLGFAWGFLKDAVNDLAKTFKKNLKDYDGDDKIGLLDVLKAVWKTVTDIGSWIDENIINPFFQGIVKGFSSGENGEAPMTWNEFWDWLFIDKLGFPPIEELKNYGKKLWENFVQGIKDGINETGMALFGNFWFDIVDFVKKCLGIHSPSTVFRSIGIDMIQGFINGVQQKWSELMLWISSAFNNIVAWCQNTVSWIQGVFSSFSSASVTASHYEGGHSGHSGAFASGGFPEDGLFFANHNELVGKFSNGKTAVANNEQIVEGIKQGVYEAVMAANSNNSGGGVTEISIDGRKLAEVLYPYNKSVAARHGGNLITEM